MLKYLFILCSVAGILSAASAQNNPLIPVIPLPYTCQATGSTLKLDTGFSIRMSDMNLLPMTVYLRDHLASDYGLHLRLPGAGSNRFIELVQTNDPLQDPEAYTLLMDPDHIKIAGQPAGLFYGIQTLLQLLRVDEKSKTVSADCYNIVDQPRYHWRGMHLDVCRHFFTVEEIKKYLDIMAYYKLNTFHWHLTDDQGWRIEIKKYPLLTQVGGFRKETMVAKNFNPYVGDHTPYGGFYTQEEIKEVVAYAHDRFITVVPEIEMPGHCLAALASYPQLCSCRIDSMAVLTKWGVSYKVYSPTAETFHFLEEVLDEVMALFPGTYIHVGGDEVPKDCWKTSAVAQQVMQENHLKNEEQLQSFFIQTIQHYLASKGRKLIGWDEILEGGLAADALVMSWRGEEGGIAAAKQAHYVVMSPGSTCYFDHAQSDSKEEPLNIGGYLPLEKVYGYNPTPATLVGGQQQFILGAQANLWTEYIPDNHQLEYMLLPRLCALAEVCWTPLQDKDYTSFKTRMAGQFQRFDQWHYAYRVPEPEIRSTNASGASPSYLISDLIPDATIYYTTDGSTPNDHSANAQGSVTLAAGSSKPLQIRAYAVTRDGTKKSVISIFPPPLKQSK